MSNAKRESLTNFLKSKGLKFGDFTGISKVIKLIINTNNWKLTDLYTTVRVST